MIPLERQRRLSMTSSAMLMMFALVCSKLLGQLREILLLYRVGQGTPVSDGFILGFQIPDLLYELLIGGAIQAAITPTLAGAIEKRTQRSGWRAVSIFLNVAALTMLVLILVGQVAAPILIPALYSSRSPETVAVAISVSRTLFPQVLFMMLAALCIGILNAYRRFERTAFGPVVYNAGVVVSMLLLGDKTAGGAVRVAAGIMLSACVFFLLQFYLARDVFHRFYRFSFDVRDPGFRRLLRLALPTMLAASIVQVNVIVLSAFINRSFTADGLVTALRNASTLWQLPYGILAVSIGNVLLPNLSGMASASSPQRFRRLFDNGLRNAMFLIVPTAFLMLAMRRDFVRAVFSWGSTYPESLLSNTSSILIFYCFSILVQTLVFLFGIACFAAGNTKIPLYGGAVSLFGNFLFSLILTSIPGVGPWAMSLAFLLSGLSSAVLIIYLFRKRFPGFSPRSVGRRFPLQMVLCGVASVLTVTALGILYDGEGSKGLELVWLAFRALAGIAVFYLAAHSLRVPEAALYAERVGSLVRRVVHKARPDTDGEGGAQPPDESDDNHDGH